MGQAFGELSLLLEGQTRSATVRALTPLLCLVLHQKDVAQLFGQIPEFGLALTRDLARKLRGAWAADTEIASRRHGETIELDEQDLSQVRAYMVRYYATAVRNIARRHQLLLDRSFPSYAVDVTLQPEEVARWRAVFEVDPTASPLFSYYARSGTLSLM